eukprot:SAG11_NODE_1447_length_4888_cov_2.819795_4_plen_141_part_00
MGEAKNLTAPNVSVSGGGGTVVVVLGDTSESFFILKLRIPAAGWPAGLLHGDNGVRARAALARALGSQLLYHVSRACSGMHILIICRLIRGNALPGWYQVSLLYQFTRRHNFYLYPCLYVVCFLGPWCSATKCKLPLGSY